MRFQTFRRMNKPVNTVLVTGSLPDIVFQCATNLESLVLRSNRVFGTLSEEISALQRLQHFDVSSNHFTSTFPTELASLTSLVYFDVSSNQETIDDWGFFGK